MSDVAIVGAGPYGLSIAAHLRGTGLGVRVFGDQMASWRHHMPVGMYLKSTPDASSLSAPTPGSSIFDYCDRIGSRALTDEDAIPMQLFIDYGMWFADRHVPDVENERVVAIERAGRDFDVTLGSGEVAAGAHGRRRHGRDPVRVHATRAARDRAGRPLAVRTGVAHVAARRPLRVRGPQRRDRRCRPVRAGERRLDVREPEPRCRCSSGGRRCCGATSPTADFDTPVYRFLKPPSALGYGWSARSMSGAPQMVRYLPAKARLALVKNVLGPSGAWWLRDRVEGHVDIHVDVVVRSAVALPTGGVRLATRDAHQRRGLDRGRPRARGDRLPRGARLARLPQ